MLHLFLKTTEYKDFLTSPAASGPNSPYKQTDFPYNLHKSSFLPVLQISCIQRVHRKQLITAMFRTVFHILSLYLSSV